MMSATETSSSRSGGPEGRNAPGARVVAEVTRLVGPVLDAAGLELDRVEHALGGKKPVVRVYIDKPGGVGVDDCAEVSRQLSVLLDDEDVIRGAFVLEVSSPGLTRPLRDEDDFRRFAGRLAVIHAKQPLVGKKREATGRLAGVEDGCVLFDEVRSGERVSVPLEDIAKARLEIED